MFKRLLGKTLEEIPSSSVRLNILMPIMALCVLATVIGIMWSKMGNQNIDQLRSKDVQVQFWQNQSNYWQHQSELKDHKIDSMNTRAYEDKIETNKELRILIDKQNSQKHLLRTLK